MAPFVKRMNRRFRLRIFNLAALELLDMLKSCDINLSLDGDKIVVKGHLTDDLRHRIREHKQHLVELIKDGEHRWGPGEEWESGQDGNNQ